QARREVNTPMSKEVPIHIEAKDEKVQEQLINNKDYLERFCNPSELIIDTKIEVPEKAMTEVVYGATVILPLEGLVDMDKETERLKQEREKWQKELERVNKKLSNEKYEAKAPAKNINEVNEKNFAYQVQYDGL